MSLTSSQASYSADLFYVLALCSTKLSGIALCHGITPIATHRIWGKAIGLFVMIWTLSAFLALMFRCSPPEVWNTLREACIDLVSSDMHPETM